MITGLNFSSFLYPDQIKSPALDCAYFSQFLPNRVATYSLVQGHTLTKYHHIERLTFSSSEETLHMDCFGPEMFLIQKFLQQQGRIKEIVLTKKGLKVIQNDTLIKKIPSPQMQFSREIDIQKIKSASSRFLPFDTTAYLSTFRHVLTELYRADKLHIDLFLYGVDSHFLARVLRKCYRPYFHVVIVNAHNHALHIHVKKLNPKSSLLAELKKEIQGLAEMIAEENAKRKEHSEEASLLEPFYSPSFISSASVASSIDSQEYEQAFWLTCSYLAYHLQLYRSQSILTDKTAEKKPSAQPAKKEIQSPRSLIKLGTFSPSSNMQKLIADDIYPSVDALERKVLKPFWQKLKERVPPSWIYQIKPQQPVLEEFAMMKSRIEAHTFDLSYKMRFTALNYTSLYQTVRSLYPHDATQPNVSVRINHQPFIWSTKDTEQDSECLSYYYCLFQEFAQACGSQNDYSSLAQKLVSFKDMKRREMAKILSGFNRYERRFLHMLQASSFSFFGRAHVYLLEKIVAQLLETYEIKYAQPQTAPTVEFFIDKDTNFKVIRTSNFFIRKDGIDKGEFIVKLIVSLYDHKWSFNLSIPVIDLLPFTSLLEGEEIFQGFDLLQTP